MLTTYVTDGKCYQIQGYGYETIQERKKKLVSEISNSAGLIDCTNRGKNQ